MSPATEVWVNRLVAYFVGMIFGALLVLFGRQPPSNPYGVDRDRNH